MELDAFIKFKGSFPTAKSKIQNDYPASFEFPYFFWLLNTCNMFLCVLVYIRVFRNKY